MWTMVFEMERQWPWRAVGVLPYARSAAQRSVRLDRAVVDGVGMRVKVEALGHDADVALVHGQRVGLGLDVDGDVPQLHEDVVGGADLANLGGKVLVVADAVLTTTRRTPIMAHMGATTMLSYGDSGV